MGKNLKKERCTNLLVSIDKLHEELIPYLIDIGAETKFDDSEIKALQNYYSQLQRDIEAYLGESCHSFPSTEKELEQVTRRIMEYKRGLKTTSNPRQTAKVGADISRRTWSALFGRE